MAKTGYRDYEADKGNILLIFNVLNLSRPFFFSYFLFSSFASVFTAKITEFLQNYQASDADNQKYAKYAVQLSKLAHREQVIASRDCRYEMFILVMFYRQNVALFTGVFVHRIGWFRSFWQLISWRCGW